MNIQSANYNQNVAAANAYNSSVNASLIACKTNPHKEENVSEKSREISTQGQINRARTQINRLAGKPGLKKNFYFFVGVSKYKYGADQYIGTPKYIKNLRYASMDARGLRECFDYEGDENIVFILTDENATKNNIKKVLEFIKNNSTGDDSLQFFWSGHGIKEDPEQGEKETDRKVYLVAHDSDSDDFGTFISMFDMAKDFDSIKAAKLFAPDACFSGRLIGKKVDKKTELFGSEKTPKEPSEDDTGIDAQKVAGLFKKQKNTVIITASSGREMSFEFGEIMHGAFSYAEMLGLGKNNIIGIADNDCNDDGTIGNGRITGLELYTFLSKSVERLMKILTYYRYVTTIDGGSVEENKAANLQRMCSFYADEELDEARNMAYSLGGYVIPQDKSRFKLEDIFMASLIIDGVLDTGSDEKFKNRFYAGANDNDGRFSPTEARKAENAAVGQGFASRDEQGVFKVQTPYILDCYPDFANRNKAEIIIKKSKYRIERQRRSIESR